MRVVGRFAAELLDAVAAIIAARRHDRGDRRPRGGAHPRAAAPAAPPWAIPRAAPTPSRATAARRSTTSSATASPAAATCCERATSSTWTSRRSSTATTGTPRAPSWWATSIRRCAAWWKTPTRPCAAASPRCARARHVGDIGHAMPAVRRGRAATRVVPSVRGPRHRTRLPRPADDLPRRQAAARAIALVPGMTFTIEPMINMGDWRCQILGDHWTVVTVDHSLSAQFEHTVTVTETGVEVLTLAGRPYALTRPRPACGLIPMADSDPCPDAGTPAPAGAEPSRLQEIRAVRLAKIEALRADGVLPFAERYERTHTLAEAYALACDQASAAAADGGGRAHGRTRRDGARVREADLLPPAGRLRPLPGRAGRGPARPGDRRALRALRRSRRPPRRRGSDGAHAQGRALRLRARVDLPEQGVRPLPEKWKGLADPEARQRARYLDLVSNPQTRERYRFRTRFLRELRAYLDAHGFEEVDTPVLQTKVSGALARPFVTHHNAMDMRCVLRIAPETWLKQCVAGGMDRVYEVARCFRNEGMDPSHLQDFMMVEWYAAYWNYEDNMDFTQQLILHLLDTLLETRTVRAGEHEIDFTPPWPRLSLRELIRRDCGIDYADHPDAASLRAAIRERGIELEDHDLDAVGRGNAHRPALQEGQPARADRPGVRHGPPARPVAARTPQRRGSHARRPLPARGQRLGGRERLLRAGRPARSARALRGSRPPRRAAGRRGGPARSTRTTCAGHGARHAAHVRVGHGPGALPGPAHRPGQPARGRALPAHEAACAGTRAGGGVEDARRPAEAPAETDPGRRTPSRCPRRTARCSVIRPTTWRISGSRRSGRARLFDQWVEDAQPAAPDGAGVGRDGGAGPLPRERTRTPGASWGCCTTSTSTR